MSTGKGEGHFNAEMRAFRWAMTFRLASASGKGKEGMSLGSGDEPDWPREADDDDAPSEAAMRHTEIDATNNCYDIDECSGE